MSEQPPVPPDDAAARPALPWEQPGAPRFAALLETIKLVLISPTEAFERMPVSPDLGRPLVYAIIVSWIGAIVALLYQLAFRLTLLPFLPEQTVPRQMVASTAFSIVIAVLAPILTLIGLFVWSAIVHVFLLIAGGANRGFTATVRVLCYASTTNVLQLIPACGGLIGVVWNIVLAIIGLSVAHRTSYGKAAVAVLVPILICCVCVGVAFALVGSFILSAILHST